jgi:hypothetical protein
MSYGTPAKYLKLKIYLTLADVDVNILPVCYSKDGASMCRKRHYIREWFDRSGCSLVQVADIVGLTKPRSLRYITIGWPNADDMKALASVFNIDPRFFFVHPDDAGLQPPQSGEPFEKIELRARLAWLRLPGE